jgi:hypothetical protein
VGKLIKPSWKRHANVGWREDSVPSWSSKQTSGEFTVGESRRAKLEDCTKEDSKPNGRKSQVGQLKRKRKNEV